MSTTLKSAAAGIPSSVRRFACTALAAASVFLVTQVHAADVIPQCTVKFDDLDLTKQKEAEVLYTRLKRAAREVCKQFNGRTAGDMVLFSECYGDALGNAVERVGNGSLSALHSANPALRVAARRVQGTPAT
jgi:UrcA family protein